MHKRWFWLNPLRKSELPEVELQHEYQNPQEALDAIEAGTDKRKPVVRAVSPASPGERLVRTVDRDKDHDPLYMIREEIVDHVLSSHPDMDLLDPNWRMAPWLAHAAHHNGKVPPHE